MAASFSLRRLAVVLLDIVAVLAAFWLAFLLRFDFELDPETQLRLLTALPVVATAYLSMSSFFSLYRGIYYFSSFSDLLSITKSVVSAGVLSAAAILFSLQGQFPRSVLLLHPMTAFLGLCFVRFGIRLGKNYLKVRRFSDGEGRPCLIVGAGELGESLLRQIKKSPESGLEVVGFVDDDRAKWGMRIHGCSVLGGRKVLPDILRGHPVQEIIIAISARRGEVVSAVVEALKEVDPKPNLKVVPSLDEMLSTPRERVLTRKVRPADLLNREVARLDEKRIGLTVQGRCILVTGAGGTIGSELCRQALRYAPRRIVLLESSATALFFCEAELKAAARGVEIIAVLGDVRDGGLLDRVFAEHRPQIVFHAAAHKHVHQLEQNVEEGISNNVLGTYHLASAADRFGAEAFLLVSTDKAVNPFGVMGATKRAAEVVAAHFAQSSRTRFAAVRFGNVLGSSGSALKIFEEQIARGGPVTVTDERATRYFMTVEEAVGLILQAVSMAEGGEVFVLKMGTPVRIMDMARNLILLHGLEPGKDIHIQLTGLQPGEKLAEQLVEDPAGLSESGHASIQVLRPAGETARDLPKEILELEVLTRGSDRPLLVRKLRELVPNYQPSSVQVQADRSP